MGSMLPSIALPAPGLNAVDLLKNNALAAAKLKAAVPGANFSDASKLKAKAAAQDFEGVFLNSMMQQMFTGLQGEGPMGGNGPTGIWRSSVSIHVAAGICSSHWSIEGVPTLMYGWNPFA